MRVYHKDGSQPNENQIFVFGSNLSGIHGAGAAKQAIRYGARFGVPVGFMGRTFAIPTKNEKVDTMSLEEIRKFVDIFVRTSLNTPNIQYFVTRIGCGLAGYRDWQIAPMFKDCGDNCSFAEEWKEFI